MAAECKENAATTEIKFDNDVFTMQQCPHPTKQHLGCHIYHFVLHPFRGCGAGGAAQPPAPEVDGQDEADGGEVMPLAYEQQLELLSQSLVMICQSTVGIKHSIILDCSALKSHRDAKTVMTRRFKEAMALGTNPPGLDRFVIVIQNILVKALMKTIIKTKKASGYTKTCNSVQKALALIAAP